MPPALEYMDLTEKAVFWEVLSHDREGMPLVKSPIELSVRWEEGQKELLSDTGERISIDVVIATTRNLPLNSLIWEGSLCELEDEIGTSYTPESDIYEIITRVRAKDLLGRVTRYEFGIKRFRDRMQRVVG